MKRSFRTWFLTSNNNFNFAGSGIFYLCMVFFQPGSFDKYRNSKNRRRNVELQLSSSGGSSFRDSQPASITQVNQTNAEYLIPVSTNDLVNFVLYTIYRFRNGRLCLNRYRMRSTIIMDVFISVHQARIWMQAHHETVSRSERWSAWTESIRSDAECCKARTCV